MNNNRLILTWEAIDTACKELASTINVPITHVVGIARGGLIPATLIAKHLNVREVISLGLKSYNDGDDYETREPVPEVYQHINQCFQISRGTSRVLIVDDITDKGNTFNFISRYLHDMSMAINFYTAALFYKESSTYTPTYTHTEVPDDEWLVFPWEESDIYSCC